MNREILSVAAFSIILVVVASFLAAAFLLGTVPSRHGEGYVDPASGIHITPSGDIKDSQGISSSSIIQRNGNIYTLTANMFSMVTIEKSNIVFDGGGFSFVGNHGLILSYASNVTVKDLGFQTHYLQIRLDHAKNSVLQNVTSSYRLQLSFSENNLVSNSTSPSIELENSDSNMVRDSVIGKISLSRSNGNSILYNTFWTQGPSLGLWQSSSNIIFGNSFEKFWWWISMSGDINRIVANNIWAGQIYFADKLAGTNYIYHNNFWNFKWNQSATTNSSNVWSMDMRGNYWANFHTGDSNQDGIVDTPFIIDKTNRDQYPLTSPVDISAEYIPQ